MIINFMPRGTPIKKIPLSDLPVGALVRDEGTSIWGVPIIWKIADQNHAGYPANSTTLITERCIRMNCYDAQEASNPDSGRSSQGNNYYKVSNIRHYLNSDENKNQWYSSQHQYDSPPNTNTVFDGQGYENDFGFLYGFSEYFKNNLVVSSIISRAPNTDGGLIEQLQDKVWMLSATECGISGSAVEGTAFPLFTNNNDRVGYVMTEAILNSTSSSKPINNQSPWEWYLRTPTITSGYQSNIIVSSGSLSTSQNPRNDRIGIRPLCNLPNTVKVEEKPIDGIYKIVW